MSLPNFAKVLEGEIKNFEISKSKFEDILTWAERIKEIASTELVLQLPVQQEYFDLMHIQGNSFIASIILLMKCHVFFSFAIARVGLEAAITMAIVESDYKNHLPIWQKYNYTKRNTSEFKEAQKKFTQVFRNTRKKHDFSAFMNEREYEVLFHTWDYLCTSGSHAGFLQTIFSVDYSDSEDAITLNSGIFDINMNDTNHIGKSMIYVIDTFFLCSKISARILNRHGVSLRKSVKEVEELFDEWVEFKMRKAKEFGIKPPEEQ